MRVPTILGAVLLLAACSGSGGDADDSTTTSTVAGPATTTSVAPGTEASPATTAPARNATIDPPTGDSGPDVGSLGTGNTPRSSTSPGADGGADGGAIRGTGASLSNTPPTARILSPGSSTRFPASFDPGQGLFGAWVNLRAEAGDADGDAVRIEWFSDQEGFLGEGASLTTRLHTIGSDASQPVITVRVTDARGAVTEHSIRVVVWIPSDQ